MLATERKRLFRPNAVCIPMQGGKEGKDFDRSDCTLLFVDGEYRFGEVYTEEAWKNDGKPDFIQRRGEFFLADGGEIQDGRVQLLPDACIVKLPERDYWCEEVQAMTKRLFGVYALDRRQRYHLCEFCTSYELWFVETQYEETHEIAEDEDKRNELFQMISEGDGQTERVTYMHRKGIDPLFLRGRRCRPGWLPKSENGGGYRLRGLVSVTWDGVMEEIAQALCNSSI